MTSGGDTKRQGQHLESLAELGLSDQQLAVMAVHDAEGTIRCLTAAGLEPNEALIRQAAGDPAEVAAYVAHYSSSLRSGRAWVRRASTSKESIVFDGATTPVAQG